MKSFFMLLLMCSFTCWANDSKETPYVLVKETNFPLQEGTCNVVYEYSKYLAEGVDLEYEKTINSNHVQFAEHFARGMLLPIAQKSEDIRTNDGSTRTIIATMFIRKNIETVLGDLMRLKDMRMFKPDVIYIKVAQNMYSLCSSQTKFHSAVLFDE